MEKVSLGSRCTERRIINPSVNHHALNSFTSFTTKLYFFGIVVSRYLSYVYLGVRKSIFLFTLHPFEHIYIYILSSLHEDADTSLETKKDNLLLVTSASDKLRKR